MHTDIKKNGWISFLPRALHPYAVLMRLDRPVGIALLLLPCLWGLMLSPSPAPALYYVLFICGAVFMRGAGCIINDIWDRDLDAQVTRTQSRPLASGTISVIQAAICLGFLLTLSFLILIQFNNATILIGIASLPLVILYPFMKRITYWPQVFLGLTFNMGALMGWSAITGSLSAAPVYLYLSAIAWTIAYDTIYAHQDIEDDMKAGIKSTAIRFGGYTRHALIVLASIQFLCLKTAWISAGNTVDNFWLMAPALIFTLWIIWRWQEHAPQSALRAFKDYSLAGWLILFGIILARI